MGNKDHCQQKMMKSYYVRIEASMMTNKPGLDVMQLIVNVNGFL